MGPFGSFNQNTKLFIHENASENIACEMAAILSRGGGGGGGVSYKDPLLVITVPTDDNVHKVVSGH